MSLRRGARLKAAAPSSPTERPEPQLGEEMQDVLATEAPSQLHTMSRSVDRTSRRGKMDISKAQTYSRMQMRLSPQSEDGPLSSPRHDLGGAVYPPALASRQWAADRGRSRVLSSLLPG